MAQVRFYRGFLLLPIFIAVFLTICGFYGGREVWSVFLGHLAPVGLVAVFLVLSYCVGMKILRLLRVYHDDEFPIYAVRRDGHWLPAEGEVQQPWREGFEPLRREILSWEKACLATGLGLGVLAYGTLLLALLQKLSLPWALAGLALVAFCVPGEIKRLYRYLQLPADWRRRGENPRKRLRKSTRTMLWLFITIPLAFGFISALAPPHQSDALRYHLAVPAQYVQHGGWLYQEDSAFSNFPATIEMLYALALVFGQDVACRLLHFAFFALTLIALYSLGRRTYGSGSGLVAAAVFACTPFVPILASWAFIELGMTFYYILTFYILALWIETQFRRKQKKGWPGAYQLPLRPERLPVLLGLYCGLALGVKYTALFLAVYVFAVMAGVLWIRTRAKARPGALEKPGGLGSLHPPRISHVFLFGGVALAVFSPWLIKNGLATGNPLFPFLNSVFKSPDWSAYEAAFYAFHAGQKGDLYRLDELGALGRIWDLIRLPWRATMDHLGGWQIGPLYLIYTPLLVLFARRLSRTLRLALWSSLYLFLVWAFTYRDNRFLLPVLALLALALGGVFGRLWQRSHKNTRPLLWGLAALLLFNCGDTVLNVCTRQYPFAVVMGKQSREAFLTERLDYWPALQFLNERPQPLNRAKVLMVGEYRPYYCRRAYLANDWFNEPVIIRYLRECGGVAPLVQRLRAEGVRYVLLNEREMNKLGGSYRQVFHFYFLNQEEARAALDGVKRQDPRFLSRFWSQVYARPLYRDYREFLYSGKYVRQIDPTGPQQEADIAVFELLDPSPHNSEIQEGSS